MQFSKLFSNYKQSNDTPRMPTQNSKNDDDSNRVVININININPSSVNSEDKRMIAEEKAWRKFYKAYSL